MTTLNYLTRSVPYGIPGEFPRPSSLSSSVYIPLSVPTGVRFWYSLARFLWAFPLRLCWRIELGTMISIPWVIRRQKQGPTSGMRQCYRVPSAMFRRGRLWKRPENHWLFWFLSLGQVFLCLHLETLVWFGCAPKDEQGHPKGQVVHYFDIILVSGKE